MTGWEMLRLVARNLSTYEVVRGLVIAPTTGGNRLIDPIHG